MIYDEKPVRLSVESAETVVGYIRTMPPKREHLADRLVAIAADLARQLFKIKTDRAPTQEP